MWELSASPNELKNTLYLNNTCAWMPITRQDISLQTQSVYNAWCNQLTAGCGVLAYCYRLQAWARQITVYRQCRVLISFTSGYISALILMAFNTQTLLYSMAYEYTGWCTIITQNGRNAANVRCRLEALQKLSGKMLCHKPWLYTRQERNSWCFRSARYPMKLWVLSDVTGIQKSKMAAPKHLLPY